MAIAVDSTVEMDTHLHHNAVNILLAIYDAEDETANTTQIGAVTGLSSPNISGNHAQTLEQEGLIERAGTVESSAPNDTNVYTVTHRGRKEAKRLLNQTDAKVPIADGEKLALLHFVKEHRREIEQYIEGEMAGSGGGGDDDLVEQVRENSKRLDDQEDALESARRTLEKVVNRVTGGQ